MAHTSIPFTRRKRGPNTPEGKRRSSQNAIKHGRYARTFFVLAHEDQAQFEDLAQRFTSRLAPADELECHLVRQLAFVEWRLLRITRMDTAALDHEFAACHDSLRKAGHAPTPSETLAAAADSLLKTTRLPVYLAARETELVHARDSLLNVLRLYRQKWPLPAPHPQPADPIDLNPGKSFPVENNENTQPVESTPLPDLPFLNPLP
jgi:hypothetical protein